jgi:hypothetical protein
MTRTRKLIIAFWIFIGCMLLWQFYTYNKGLDQASIDHPQQEHFWYTNSLATSTAPAAPTSAHRDGADVQQIHYSVEDDTPSAGNMTCVVTLKNMGNAKAVSVQIFVRPFRGASNYDEDVGHSDTKPLSDDDPISQIGEWLTFPDLAPGESSTQSVSFLSRHFVIEGKNPKPQILFQTEKPPPRQLPDH